MYYSYIVSDRTCVRAQVRSAADFHTKRCCPRLPARLLRRAKGRAVLAIRSLLRQASVRRGPYLMETSWSP